MAAHVVLPWAHRTFSNLKVWALGVYHGLPRKHLQPYLDEFVLALHALSGEFAKLYSPIGRVSIPPERLLRALLLQAF